MPQKYLEGRTIDPATWMRTPENLERLAAITRKAGTRRRAIEDRRLRTRPPTRSTCAAKSTSSSASFPTPPQPASPAVRAGDRPAGPGAGKSARASPHIPCDFSSFFRFFGTPENSSLKTVADLPAHSARVSCRTLASLRTRCGSPGELLDLLLVDSGA